MNGEEYIELLRKNTANALKEEIIKEMELDFVENPKHWKKSLEMTNTVIKKFHGKKRIKPYVYDDYCLKVSDAVKYVFDNEVGIDNFTIKKDEYFETMLKSSSEEDAQQRIQKLLDERIMLTLKNTINFNVNRKMIKDKIGEDNYEYFKEEIENLFE